MVNNFVDIALPISSGHAHVNSRTCPSVSCDSGSPLHT